MDTNTIKLNKIGAVVITTIAITLISTICTGCATVYDNVDGTNETIDTDALRANSYWTDPMDKRLFGKDIMGDSLSFGGEREFLAEVTDKNTIRITPLVLNKSDMNQTVDVVWTTIDPNVHKSRSEYHYVKKGVKIGESVDMVLPEDFEYGFIGTIYPDKNNVSGYAGRVNGKVQLFRKDFGIDSKAKWDKVIKKIDEKKALTTEIKYPTPEVNIKDDIEELVNGIISSKEKELGRKLYDGEVLYLVSTYIVKNYAYDSWLVDENKYKDKDTVKTRAKLMGDAANPEYYIINNNVGTCYDFAGIIGIAARMRNLPSCMMAVTFEHGKKASHGLCAVKLDGKWVTFDLTGCTDYVCKYEDTSKDKWQKTKGQWSLVCNIGSCPEMDDYEVEAFCYNFYSGTKIN